MQNTTDFVSSILAPFTLPFACEDPVPILHLLLCVNVSDAARGEFCSSADPPLEGLKIGEPNQCEWISQRRGAGACQSYSLFTTQVPHST